MPATKGTGLTALTGADSATGDILFVVDISDTTMGASGTTKKMTRAELAVAIANAFTLSGAALSIGTGAFTAGAGTFSGDVSTTSSGNTAKGFYARNTDTGASTYASLYLGDSVSATSAILALVGSGTSTYGGARSMIIGTNTTAPLVAIVNGTEIVRTATTGQTVTGNSAIASANAATWTRGQTSELLTLSTSGTTTDTTADLPANSIIEAVVGRVTTTITTATSWQLGDPTTAGRFTAANSTMTAGTTDVGLVHIDQTGAAGPRQTATAKVRVTTVGTPGAGAIRITWFYRTLVAPTS